MRNQQNNKYTLIRIYGAARDIESSTSSAKTNVQVFCWLNSGNNLKALHYKDSRKLTLPSNHQRQASVTFLRAQNIFLAERSGSRYDYRTVHGSPILQAILK